MAVVAKLHMCSVAFLTLSDLEHELLEPYRFGLESFDHPEDLVRPQNRGPRVSFFCPILSHPSGKFPWHLELLLLPKDSCNRAPESGHTIFLPSLLEGVQSDRRSYSK